MPLPKPQKIGNRVSEIFHKKTTAIVYSNSNGDHDVMVVDLYHAEEAALERDAVAKVATDGLDAWTSSDDGEREDFIETALKEAGYEVIYHPNYQVVDLG